MKTSAIKCKLHNRNGLYINQETYSIFCSKCKNKERTANLEFEDVSEDIENQNCRRHPNTHSFFYCLDCSQSICHNCIVADHRNHLSDTPNKVATKFQDRLRQQFKDIKEMESNGIEMLNDLNPIYDKICNDKQQLVKIQKDVEVGLEREVNSKIRQFKIDIENIYQGLDVEVENTKIRLEKAENQTDDIYEEFRYMLSKMSAENLSDEDIYDMISNFKDKMQSHKSFLDEFVDFMSKNFDKTKERELGQLRTIEEKAKEKTKEIEEYEQSFNFAILSGIPKNLYKCRRFVSYKNENSAYFNSTSISIRTDRDVILSGLGICGIFKNLRSSGNFIDIYRNIKVVNLEKDEIKCKLSISERFADMDTNEITRKDSTSDYGIRIKECDLTIKTIDNTYDPVFYFYLDQVQTLAKDKIYVIRIKNLSPQNCYINIWKGITGDSESEQTFRCSNTGINFTLENAEGYESDFNEVNEGIISDILFGAVDSDFKA